MQQKRCKQREQLQPSGARRKMYCSHSCCSREASPSETAPQRWRSDPRCSAPSSRSSRNPCTESGKTRRQRESRRTRHVRENRAVRSFPERRQSNRRSSSSEEGCSSTSRFPTARWERQKRVRISRLEARNTFWRYTFEAQVASLGACAATGARQTA